MLTHLPLYAQVAYERLYCDASLRTESKLDELLRAYAKSYRMDVMPADRERTVALCRQRFHDFIT